MSTVHRPATLSDRVAEVARILALRGDDPTLGFDRIARFISLLGWDRVRVAAEYTATRKGRIKIPSPWWYTVGVINQNSARASYLYTLFHWTEIALRGALDCALAERFGADWHKLTAPIYLDAPGAQRLWREYINWQNRQANRSYVTADDRPAVQWKLDAATGNYIPHYDSPEEFLAALDFQPLTEMVLYTYKAVPRMKPILVANNGQQLFEKTVRDEFRWMRKLVRNTIMHNRADALDGPVFDLQAFNLAAARMEKVLEALRYNLPPALGRHEERRWSVVDDAVKRMGAKNLETVLSDVRAGRRFVS